MMRRLSVFSALLLAAAPAAAQDKPISMIGTWLIKGDGLSTGTHTHPEYSHSGPDAKALPVEHRWVIDKQDGYTFTGTIVGPSGTKEAIMGVMARDGKRGISANAHGGINDMTFVNANTIDMCHASADGKRIVIACGTATREK
jgi:hypothetical protein